MVKHDELSASQEDYLEAICHIAREKGAARAKDLSRWLKVTNSSVTGALQALAHKGLINYAPYDVITLTPKGRSAAENVISRHDVLRQFFTKVLVVDEDLAQEAACRMEHAMPAEILERFVRFFEFLEHCPHRSGRWVKAFRHFLKHGEALDVCEDCMALCVKEAEKGGPE